MQNIVFNNKVPNKKDSLSSGNLLIVIRGQTFRKVKYINIDKFLCKSRIFSEYIQIYCIKSFIKYVFRPIKETYPNLQISVELLVYPHKKNDKLVKLISNHCECKITNLSKNEDNQVSTFIKCINQGIKHNVDGLLILRPDLAFIQNLNPRNLSDSMALFQWNLLHDNISLEMADQIHFLGKKTLKPIYKATLQNPIDEKWKGTLHNFLRFTMKVIPKDKIGYLNYIEDPNPNRKTSRVEIRGNPTVDMGNPLFLYSTQIRKILFRENILKFIQYLVLKVLDKFRKRNYK